MLENDGHGQRHMQNGEQKNGILCSTQMSPNSTYLGQMECSGVIGVMVRH